MFYIILKLNINNAKTINTHMPVIMLHILENINVAF